MMHTRILTLEDLLDLMALYYIIETFRDIVRCLSSTVIGGESSDTSTTVAAVIVVAVMEVFDG